MYLCGSLYSCHFLFLFNNSLSVYFPLPSHTNLICFISIFSSHISFFFASFICLIPLLVLCHSPHFLPIALVLLASSKALYTTEGLVHQHLSDLSDCGIRGGGVTGGLLRQSVTTSCTETVSLERMGALCCPTCCSSSVVAHEIL